MERRRLIQAGLGAILFAPGLALSASTNPKPRREKRIFYYDPRFFDPSPFMATSLFPLHFISVGSDVTPLWRGGLQDSSSQQSLMMQGVTTESFHFCLTQLLQPVVVSQGDVHRLNPDTVAWTIATDPSWRTGWRV